jgi:hypothetical protein
LKLKEERIKYEMLVKIQKMSTLYEKYELDPKDRWNVLAYEEKNQKFIDDMIGDYRDANWNDNVNNIRYESLLEIHQFKNFEIHIDESFNDIWLGIVSGDYFMLGDREYLCITNSLAHFEITRKTPISIVATLPDGVEAVKLHD